MNPTEFQQHVIEKSHERPIVVDFWAEWCGPCRVLGPVIEAVAADAQGKWELVKVDTEASKEVSQNYQIMSIPAVKMFHKGEIIAEFAGALPRSHIENWLEEHLPNPRKAELIALHARLIADQRDPQIVQDLSLFVQNNPDLVEARIWLAQEKVRTDPEGALSMVEDIHMGSKWNDQAEDVRALAELLQTDVSEAEHINEILSHAQSALASGDYEAVLEKLVEAIMRNKAFANELSRRACLAVFRILGESHPLTKKFRPRFSMALY